MIEFLRSILHCRNLYIAIRLLSIKNCAKIVNKITEHDEILTRSINIIKYW